MDIYRELFARLRRKGLSPAHAAAEAIRRAAAIQIRQRSARILRVETFDVGALDGADPRPIAIFAHHGATDRLSRATQRYLEALRAVSSAIVFVSTTENFVVSDAAGYADVVIVRTNIGYDFGSWKVGLAHAGGASGRGVILANDSVFGPRVPLTPFFERMAAHSGIWGLTDSFEITPHLQSYFLVIPARVATAAWFRRFWSQVVQLPNEAKYLIVRLYEVGFSRAAAAAGFGFAACFETERLAGRYPDRTRGSALDTINPTSNFWRELVTEEDFPFLKRGMLRSENRAAFDAADIDSFVADHFAAFADRP